MKHKFLFFQRHLEEKICFFVFSLFGLSPFLLSVWLWNKSRNSVFLMHQCKTLIVKDLGRLLAQLKGTKLIFLHFVYNAKEKNMSILGTTPRHRISKLLFELFWQLIQQFFLSFSVLSNWCINNWQKRKNSFLTSFFSGNFVGKNEKRENSPCCFLLWVVHPREFQKQGKETRNE